MIKPISDTYLYYHKLSKFFSVSTKSQLLDRNLWPESWKKIEYKEYNNSKQIQLSNKEKLMLNSDLLEVILKRESDPFFFKNKNSISLADISTVLNFSMSRKGYGSSDTKRVHPSAGGRYPLEGYLIVQKGKDITNGLYHYNIKHHRLECMDYLEPNVKLNKLSSYEWVKDAACIFILTALFERNTRKYSERGYRTVLLEAGHIMQNVSLLCTKLNLPIRSLSGIYDDVLEQILGLDGETESVVYVSVFG